MESPISWKTALPLLGFAIIFFKLLKTKAKKSCTSNLPPEPPGRWPVLGHMHLLGKDKALHRTLVDLADRHGPLITLYIGAKRTVVVSNWELAKECYTKHDKFLANRPRMGACDHLTYNYAMFGIAPYGSYWRQLRKIATLHLLSSQQLELLKHVRITEIDNSIQQLYELWLGNGKLPVKVEMKKWFGDLTFNNIVKMVAGKRYYGSNVAAEDEEEGAKFRQAINKFFLQFGSFVVSDAVPALKFIDELSSFRGMKKTAKEMDFISSKWLKEHQQRRSSHNMSDQDFMDVLISILEESPLPDYDTDTIIKATAQAIILGGSDTTSVALTWTLALVMNNINVLEKLQDELDKQVGKDRNVEESDIQNLPYLQAIVKESFRMYPPGPLGLPHEAMEDVSIGGFHVPKGTNVIINIWKIQHDERFWEDPFKFKPERFLTTNRDVDVKGQSFQLLPFGSGRRVCSGIGLALQVVHLTIARLLHGFEVKTLKEETRVDMTEETHSTMNKARAFEVLITPRLSSLLYN